MVDGDLPDESKEAYRTGVLRTFSAGGIFEQDDIDNWAQVTQAAKSPMARKLTADLSMGVGRSHPSEEWPGDHSERYISENNQRGYYLRWEEFMNADSWRDIHLDPHTAKYEGTAKFEG